MSCKKSLENAIRIGHMIDHGFEPKFLFTSLEQFKNIPSVDDCNEDDVGIYSVQFNKDGTQVVAGSMNSTIRIFNTTTSNKKSSVTMKPSKFILGMPITCIRYVPNSYNRLVACSPSGQVHLCYPDNAGFETIIKEDNETYALDLSSDGNELATGGRDRQIRIYRFSNAGLCEDTRLGNVVPRFMPTSVDADMRQEGHGMTIHAIKYRPENSCQIVSAGWDNIVKLWDTRSGIGPVWRVSGPHICSPDGIDLAGDLLYTASWRGKNALQIWDLRFSKDELLPADTIPVVGEGWNCEQGDTEYLYNVKVGDNNSVITGGSGFSGIRVVNKENHRPIGEIHLNSCVNTLDIIFGGRQIVSGLSNGNLVLCRMK